MGFAAASAPPADVRTRVSRVFQGAHEPAGITLFFSGLRTFVAGSCQCHRISGTEPMSDRRSDQELIARVQAGDRRAFDLLVIKYQQKVASLISRYIRDSGEVMDVAQEAFLKAYRALPGFRGESAFIPGYIALRSTRQRTIWSLRLVGPPERVWRRRWPRRWIWASACRSWARRSIIC